ncbi:MAG: 4-hydroxy-tetrahydrodipicolinate reductase [Actinobacteria bacterium]|nr:4-hydroxy-tetrahydrodipicolinate reductase [Actinomycetota bacterium]
MIKVLICGIYGRMGTCTANAVATSEDMELLAGVDNGSQTVPLVIDGTEVRMYRDLSQAIDETKPDVMVDFTHPSAVEGNIRIALSKGVDCVVGTTGLAQDVLEDAMASAADDVTLFVAPNFTTGAVLMMEFAKTAAKYFPDIEIIEFHHDGKADSPSGTAIRTAHLIAEAKTIPTNAPGNETELPGMEGARGALVEGIPIHSVRTEGYVAHQEVIFGSKGQTLTIRHDSIDRASYMPGVLLAIRNVKDRKGLIVGLEKLMDL